MACLRSRANLVPPHGREALGKNLAPWMIERFKRRSSAPTHCSLPAPAGAGETRSRKIPPMKRLLIAAFVVGFAFAPANAQTTTPEAAPPPAAGAPAAGAPAAASPATGSPNAKPTGKQARAQCQAQAKAQGLTGPARKQAVQDCFASARPDLAQAQKCRQQAKANGLQDTQLTAFMRQCKTAAQSGAQ